MSAHWNALGNRFWDAVATFAAAGRLVDADDSGAIVRVGNEERWPEPATLVTAAQMMQKNGIVPAREYARLLNSVEGNVEVTGEGSEGDPPVGELITDAMIEENFNQAMRDLDNTARGQEAETQERRNAMNFHHCSVTRKYTWAGEDGRCRRCRSGEVVAEILNRTEETGPTFEELLGRIGGEGAYRASLEEVEAAKRNGRPGNSVKGRKPRELLNLIMTQSPLFIPDLLDKYRKFTGQFGIQIRHDPDGVLFHDYQVFAPRSTGPTGTGPTGTGWQANLAQKRAMRNAFVESVRTSRDIVMSWVSTDGTQAGSTLLGPNTSENRLLAGQLQAAARKKGFHTRFTLVQG